MVVAAESNGDARRAPLDHLSGRQGRFVVSLMDASTPSIASRSDAKADRPANGASNKIVDPRETAASSDEV